MLAGPWVPVLPASRTQWIKTGNHTPHWCV
jgi:hypothetical protein